MDLGVQYFLQEMERVESSQRSDHPLVIHLFFELGYSFFQLETRNDENVPLAIFIKYSQSVEQAILPSSSDSLSLEPLSQISFEKYHQQFNEAYRNLLDGETYQLNLTHPFYLRPSDQLSPQEYINRFWQDPFKVGAYAHATYIDALDKLFLSNSPECLFQIKTQNNRQLIQTMPIKGTERVSGDDWKEAWKKLRSSSKNQAELYMITDLMRNDLSRLTGHPSRVLYKKYPLHVPGLIHQFSVVESLLPKDKNLADIIKALFPGGSVTGAPKKNTLRLIGAIENYRRGFYCGSTILFYKQMKTASINIRSCEIDFTQNEIKYGTGGGVTLQSQAFAEYEETLNKLKSFLLLVK